MCERDEDVPPLPLPSPRKPLFREQDTGGDDSGTGEDVVVVEVNAVGAGKGGGGIAVRGMSAVGARTTKV